eukprot:7591833-Alexandrium_andersonii.AAC.1
MHGCAMLHAVYLRCAHVVAQGGCAHAACWMLLRSFRNPAQSARTHASVRARVRLHALHVVAAHIGHAVRCRSAGWPFRTH